MLAAHALHAAAVQADDPETTIRALVTAIYANDPAAYERVTLPAPTRDRLVRGGSVNQEKLRQLEEDPEGLQIEMKQPFTWRGEAAVADQSGAYPLGTTVRYMVAHYGSPMIVTLVRTAEGWKVDLRWWLAMLDAASGVEPKPDSAELAVRRFTAALIALDRKEAARFVMPPVNLDMVFDGAPRQPEPSGHLDALVMEMGLVEIGAGEFVKLPSGRVVEGGSTADRKVLVGVFGPIEVPYVVQRAGSAWKVAPEPYFHLLSQ
jgi:hypothetical protein